MACARLVDQYANNARPAASLKSLAGMGSFTLFVSLTPDNLLERALRQSDEARDVRVGAYSPRDASESVADIILPRQGERGVFQLFGSCANIGGGFAMHEEDALEFLFRLQSDAARRFTGLLSELRRRDLLFIGCGFPDWLGRRCGGAPKATPQTGMRSGPAIPGGPTVFVSYQQHWRKRSR